MITPRHLFRAQALQEYARRRERDILPPTVRPPVLLCCWLLLGLLLAAMVFAWQIPVPVSVTASGIIVQQGAIAPQEAAREMAVLFVPATAPVHIPVGQAITLQLTGESEPLHATIGSVETGVISPEAARQQYGLTGNLAGVVTQPSVVVTLMLSTDLSPTLAERSVRAQILLGSASLLSRLPALLQDL